MKIVFLDRDTLGKDSSFDAFEALGEVHYFASTKPDETASRIQGAEVVVTNKVLINEALMRATPTLKLICVAATGMNNIDLEAAKELGISVRNVAGYSTDSVVQHTFSMLFYLIGKSRYYDDYVKRNQWQRSDIFTHLGQPFHEIAGKKWGIIGLGTIGKKVARVAQAFSCEVAYYSSSGANHDREFKKLDLEPLLKESDIISIHAPLNEKTHNLLNRSNLSYLKEDAVLLNLGRGGIINEKDLADVLQTQSLYVGLDVLEKEPIAMDNPLLNHLNERLYITPHIAWTSVEARARLLDSVAQSIKAYQEEKQKQ